jgi:tRNA A-37 threonylcarbamoyl transferase component Bud32
MSGTGEQDLVEQRPGIEERTGGLSGAGAAVFPAKGSSPAPSPGRDEGSLLPVVQELCGTEATRAAGWSVEPGTGADGVWIRVRNQRSQMPDQGWKLHVSAAVSSAEEVLRQALPVLLTEDAAFKVGASLRFLMSLNDGEGGRAQIGKFITVYPADDPQAVRLAVALDRATRGLRGPAVPTDRPLAPGSLVHYRYGSFGRRRVQSPMGAVMPALLSPDGALVAEPRAPGYRPPPWVTDPFIAAGAAPAAEAPDPLLGGRYLRTARIYDSPRGGVYVAVDTHSGQRRVLKQARRDATMSLDGQDARDRLRHEREVLLRLAPDPRFPAVYDLVEHEGDLFLVMEDVEGVTLDRHVSALVGQGRFVPGEQVAAWGRELAGALASIHQKGLVYRDLKPPNVIVTGEGRLRLVDFEIAQEAGAPVPAHARGTRGYLPRLEPHAPAGLQDDVYSLGALLYFAATGAEPAQAPNPYALMDRPLRLLNGGIGPGLAAVIARCLKADPAERFPSMELVEAALEAVGPAAAIDFPLFGTEANEPDGEARRRYRDLAARLGETLCRVARPAPDGQGRFWVSSHPAGVGTGSRDLNNGSAGTVLVVAELASEMDRPDLRETLAEGARWLALPPPSGARLLPGLYVGEAGAGAALLRAGLVLKDEALIAAASERGRWVAEQPYASPDLFNGTAGRLRFHLWLWEATGEAEFLQAAREAGEQLLAGAEPAGEDGVRWTIPSGYDGMSNTASVGYSHGAAGIADALLDLFEATGEERYLAPAQGAGRWLGSLAVPALEDGSGLNWPVVEGGRLAQGFWCHGAAGISRFFLHAARLDVLPEAAALAARAARSVARGTRWAAPTQCHGLSGSIECLLDAFHATGDRAYLAEAGSLARLLEAFAVERDGMLLFSSESPAVFTPDLMVGYAGVAACLLRLSDPERLPHLLSHEGFRRLPHGLSVS